MEIISYVQTSSRRNPISLYRVTDRITAGVFQQKKRKKINKVGESAYIFSSKPFSVKGCFAGIGRFVSSIQYFFADNYKTILITLLILSALSAAVFYGVKTYLGFVNHTGPVLFSDSDKIDYDNLDKFMTSFALDPAPAVDLEGNLLDSEINMKGIFSQPVSYQNYKVKSGDTISGITKKFGLSNISTLISVNDISNVRQLAAGQKLKIPSIDGVVYTVKKGDSLESIVGKYKIRLESLLDVNELTNETLTQGQILFIPGAALDRNTLQNAMGELFILPIATSFRWTSPYGWRADPFTGVKSFHTGTDMACPQGTPILASQSGRVSTVGFNRVYGNYIILDHGNGYQTLYAHMYKTIAKKGSWVSQGTRIGLVGTTGYSTGPHLHFMVYKNGNRIDPMTVLKK